MHVQLSLFLLFIEAVRLALLVKVTAIQLEETDQRKCVPS